MGDHNFQCGDMLRCTSRYYAEQLNIVGHPGIVMGTKPAHIHLWYEHLNRSFWLNADILRRMEDPPLSPLLTRIRSLSFALQAEEWELEETDTFYRLLLYVDELPYETLSEVRHYLDVDYRTLSVAPEGMGRMIAKVEWLK